VTSNAGPFPAAPKPQNFAQPIPPTVPAFKRESSDDHDDQEEVLVDDFDGQCCRTYPYNHSRIQRWHKERRERRRQRAVAASSDSSAGGGGGGGGAVSGGGGGEPSKREGGERASSKGLHNQRQTTTTDIYGGPVATKTERIPSAEAGQNEAASMGKEAFLARLTSISCKVP